MEITPLLATALLLNITTLLELFAQCNRIADARDQEEIRQRVITRKHQRSRIKSSHEEETDADMEELEETKSAVNKSSSIGAKNSSGNANNHHDLTSEAGIVNQILMTKHYNKSGGNVV